MYCFVTISPRFLHIVLPETMQRLVGSVALLVARRTNDRKVAGSRPTKVVCITVLTDEQQQQLQLC